MAVRYKDALSELTTNRQHFRWFGVIESKVQQNLAITLKPQLYDIAYGCRRDGRESAPPKERQAGDSHNPGADHQHRAGLGKEVHV